jgi:hypothetical protein
MAVRVSRELFDPLALGASGGGVPFVEDGEPPVPWQPRPFDSKEEYVVSEAMRLMQVSADVIRQTRPPVPQMLFPPIYGYDTTPLTIDQVLDVNRWAPQYRSYSSGISRAPRRTDFTEDMWSGTLRNFSSSPNVAG